MISTPIYIFMTCKYTHFCSVLQNFVSNCQHVVPPGFSPNHFSISPCRVLMAFSSTPLSSSCSPRTTSLILVTKIKTSGSSLTLSMIPNLNPAISSFASYLSSQIFLQCTLSALPLLCLPPVIGLHCHSCPSLLSPHPPF